MDDVVAAVPGPAGEPAAAAPAPAAAAPADAPPVFQHPSGIVPQLQNVVSTVNVGCKLDLASIAQRARNAEYNPKRFAACIIRIREPKTTALMFNSGKMVIAGARSQEQSRTAAKKYTKILSKLGYQTAFSEFNVQNMVASCSVDFPIRLEGLAAHFEMFVHYEPEVFPGLVFRMRAPRVVLLIFVTGKIVITGAKKVEDIYEAFTNIYGVLQDHRKGDARRLVRPADAAAGPAPSAITNGDGAGPSGLPALPGQGDTMPGLNMMGQPTMLRDPLAAAEAVYNIPAPTPAAGSVPPPTPAAGQIPPPTPAAGRIPAPIPMAAANIPPPTPATALGIPPPTPAAGLGIPPPTPATGVIPAPAANLGIPPPTPATNQIPPPTPKGA